ncbi:ADP-ribosylglycohydrolase family protein [Lacrimispora sp.]|uniref:ADP-ribosylglycohydrolase family protein n=1 Tax=Lacrimispora sp. TaxID=2719234 RepID=UPI00285B7544|nr:ADP-ribosylglycohydrolase family protein [Lacrimispora sp.]MDR7811856.1 ADP-ribosylglycohydrolase family protein [Lacrimispora sp.]
MKNIIRFKNDIYAGVLGKIIGVYLGRPVEGWTYEKICGQFHEIYYYKNHKTGAPLIVPDDDISGTFAFFRSLEDHEYDPEITAENIGDTWLNYIIENKTILWWGGLSRSTEHTAYLRLKNGIKAPHSGSMVLNGRSMAEQIGSEIFIDTWAMVNPGNPARAAKMAKAAASVSHDGIAIDAAVYLAVMEAMAFVEKDINKLLDEGLHYVENPEFKKLVSDVRERCESASDWREVRQWIADYHGYERYPGNCPVVTNHLTLLMAFIMGGDDFNKSCMIACSSGWDTDCNSGNVGCLNGIRLGLDGFTKGADLRRAVADRLYVVTSDGGSCISDAVLETRKILAAACRLESEEAFQPRERLAFEYPGSVQGIIPYDQDVEESVLAGIENCYGKSKEYGCRISFKGLGAGVHASVCIDTFIDLAPKGKEGTSYFDVLCSPALYSGQEVTARVLAPETDNPSFEFFIVYFDEDDQLKTLYDTPAALIKGENVRTWTIPDVGGHAIYRLGIRLKSEKRLEGSIVLKSLDWSNVPVFYRMGGSMEMTPSLTPWTTTTAWMKTFVSSADNFCPDYTTTFSISHGAENGVVTTGTLDWDNYSVKSRITFSQQDGAGLVARAKGHRRYYGAVLTKGKAVIYRQNHTKRVVISSADYEFQIDNTYELQFTVESGNLTLYVEGKPVVTGTDSHYHSGGAGFVVDSGAILGDGFEVKRIGGNQV